MKPDITFFGEKLSNEFETVFERDRDIVDLLFIMGSSLKVKPVSDIMGNCFELFTLRDTDSWEQA
jgi:NAD-dependent histone deacetylase SIR2